MSGTLTFLVTECNTTLRWLSDFIDGERRECFYFCKQLESGKEFTGQAEENTGFPRFKSPYECVMY